jgi:hypothetical protein
LLFFRADFEFEAWDGRYRADMSGSLQGLPAKLYTYDINAESEGSFQQGAPEPQRFRYGNRKGGKPERWVELHYDETGMPQVAGAEPPVVGADHRRYVPPEWRADTIDPLSAVIAVIEAGAGEEACSGVKQVFDGRRRYDLTFRAGEVVTLAPSSLGLYEGAALECEAGMTVHKGRRHFKKGQKPPKVTLQMAEIDAALPPLPVRASAPHRLGKVRIYLVDYRVLPSSQRAAAE